MVNKKRMCLCTRSDQRAYMQNLELWLVRFVFSKEEDEEEDEQSVKIMFTCISYLVTFLLCLLHVFL